MKLGKARVTSKRKGGIPAAPHETIIHADRTNRILGNRHILHNHRDPEERARVIAAHGRDLDADLAVGGPISRELHRLAVQVALGKNIAFACWCAPRPCHADRYAEIVNARAAEIGGEDAPA